MLMLMVLLFVLSVFPLPLLGGVLLAGGPITLIAIAAVVLIARRICCNNNPAAQNSISHCRIASVVILVGVLAVVGFFALPARTFLTPAVVVVVF